jgi:hypothetical protein
MSALMWGGGRFIHKQSTEMCTEFYWDPQETETVWET